MSKLSQLFICLVVFSLIFTFTAKANIDFEDVDVYQWIDPDIPESWYEEPKTASELNLNEFNQSPLLEEKVKEGEIPSVEERLPEDPPVIEPYKEIGEYGGTFQSWGTGLSFHGAAGGGIGILTSDGSELLGRATPDGKEVVPHLAEGWEQKDEEGKIWRLSLREGMKWSDGEQFTVDDIMFWWEYVANHEDLNPIPPEDWDPSIVDVKKIDDYTVEFHYGKPEPTLGDEFHIMYRSGAFGIRYPAHHFKQYHIEFRDEEELLKEAEEEGFDYWYEYFEYNDVVDYPDRARPTLLPFVIKERTTDSMKLERNPYYPFVDTEGNQLPYIDEARVNMASQDEMVSMKHFEGEVNMAGRFAYFENMPAYKKNEEKGGYEILQYTNWIPGFCVLQLNRSHDNEKINDLFNNPKFNQAISLGIDRNEINERVFFGEAVPMQVTTLPGTRWFESENAESYIEHNPERAKEKLDEIGMEDVDGDGYRNRPDGEPFTFRIIYDDHWGPMTPILELVQSHLEDISIDVELNRQDFSLITERRLENEFDVTFMQTNTATEIIFPRDHDKMIPSNHSYGRVWSVIPEYYRYWETKGEEGEKPPEYYQEIKEKADILRYTNDEQERTKIGKELLRQNAEDLWSIGTVGLTPKPVIIKNLNNVPNKGLWTDDMQYLNPMYPSQFYLKE